MDMHIHMGYCTQESFRILANNYHSIDYHDTYPEIEKLIKEVTVTPAEVAEVLMRNDDTDAALHDLVAYLQILAQLGGTRTSEQYSAYGASPRSRTPQPRARFCSGSFLFEGSTGGRGSPT